MSTCFFFDTSALVKLYHEEAGTEELTALIERENPLIAVSDIAAVEMVSAFAKKVRTAEIDIPAFEEAIAAFQSDLSQFHVITVESTIMARASDLLKTAGLKNALKTLDSLQLASALVFSERSKLDLFIAADGVLMKIAEETGLKVMAA
jgi:predicted nucleic acid-binding protein